MGKIQNNGISGGGSGGMRAVDGKLGPLFQWPKEKNCATPYLPKVGTMGTNRTRGKLSQTRGLKLKIRV